MSHVDELQDYPQIAPEFRAKLMHIFSAWQKGDTPYADACKQLDLLFEQTQGNLVHQGRIKSLYGIMQGYRGELVQSLAHLEEARKLYEEVGALADLMTVNINIGETYRQMGNPVRARSHFHRAAQNANKVGRRDIEATALSNEGQMWLSLEGYSKAQMVLSEAQKLCEKPWRADEDLSIRRNRMDTLCEVYQVLVTLNLHQKQYEQAWQYAQRAYDIAQDTGYPLSLGFAHRALGDILTVYEEVPNKDLRKEPDEHYRVALDYFREIKFEGEVGKTLYHYGRSLANRNKTNQASRMYSQAMVIFTKLGMTDDAAKAAEAQLDIL
jgi:tetratricopeptide (TPR) repeat protein